jgi:hypothetical protein
MSGIIAKSKDKTIEGKNFRLTRNSDKKLDKRLSIMYIVSTHL